MEEKEKLYDDKDVKIEVMRARGAGGQVGIPQVSLETPRLTVS